MWRDDMIVKEGLSYRTNLGRRIGPVAILPGGMVVTSEEYTAWDLQGRRYGRNYLDSEFLLEEWTDAPIRTITRKEIVQGNYGIVAITKSNKVMIAAGNYTADQLREAAHILNQIAEALEND
jgi:hypothetical protein